VRAGVIVAEGGVIGGDEHVAAAVQLSAVLALCFGVKFARHKLSFVSGLRAFWGLEWNW